MLGICYGFQVMAKTLGGEVANTGLREYGATDASVSADGGVLLGDQPVDQTVWMSHGDQVSKAPPASTSSPRPARPPSPRSAATSADSTACSGTPR